MLKRFRPVIRIFVSSTFSDLTEERNALEKYVWPELDRFCQKQGFQFQAIDLRWGVSTEAGLDHRTMKICFDELKRSQEISPQPNFLILLGDRYGWRPLPEEISADEFQRLLAVCRDDHERSTLQTWYRSDENAIPVKHLLRSRRDSPDGVDYTLDRQFRDHRAWLAVQALLWKLINRAFPVEQLDDRFIGQFATASPIPAIVRFQASATEQEIWNGAFSVPDAAEYVVAVSREITNLSDCLDHPTVGSFMNMTDNGEPDLLLFMELGSLTYQLRDFLGNNFVEIPQPVVLNEVIDSDHALRLKVSTDHLAFLCRSVEERFKVLIQRQIDQFNAVDGMTSSALKAEVLWSLQRENDEHARFAAERAPEGRFLGRESELTAIRKYVGDGRAFDESHTKPFVLVGRSGSGKSAVMAAAAQDARKRSAIWLGGAIVIERYLGTTRHSSDIRSLLTELCHCLREHFPLEEAIPSDVRLLEKEFYAQLENASIFQPIVVFLDALDQLDSAEDGLRLWWIRSTPLSEGVRIILSCATDVEDSAEPSPWNILKHRGFVQAGNSIVLRELDIGDAKELWSTWMASAGRTLTASQQLIIDDLIVRGSESCRQPLYLKILFEEARQWPSWHQPPLPGSTVNEMLLHVLEELSLPERHGPLVQPALSYLASAKYGLTENELLEILHRDSEYNSVFTRSAHHRLPSGSNRIPIAVWSRLRHDLAPYLTERGAPGGTVLQFFHRQIATAVRAVYLQASEQKARRHRQLILYFARQHWWLEPRSQQQKRMVPPYSARPVNVRKVTELPEHLIQYAISSLTERPPQSIPTSRIRRLLAWFMNGPAERPSSGRYASEESFKWIHRVLLSLEFAEAINEAGRLPQALILYAKIVELFPADHPWRRFLRLFADAIHRHSDFIHDCRSNYPQALFQTVWNLSWTNSSFHLEDHYELSGPFSKWDTWISTEEWVALDSSLQMLRTHVEKWRRKKEASAVGHTWTRSLRPPPVFLGAALTSVVEKHKDAIWCVAFSPDGSAIATGTNSSIFLWDRFSGDLIRTVPDNIGPIFSFEDEEYTSLLFSPDGKHILVRNRHGLTIWPLNSDSPIGLFRDDESSTTVHAIPSIAWSDDNTKIAATAGNIIYVWSLGNPMNVDSLAENSNAQFRCVHETTVTSIAFSADSHRVVSGARDGQIRVWNADSGVELLNIRPAAIENWIKLDKEIERGPCQPIIESVAFSPNGEAILGRLGDGTLRIWNSETGREKSRTRNFGSGTERAQTKLRIASNGQYAVCGAGNKIEVWTIASGGNEFIYLTILQGHKERISDLDFAPDGETLVSASLDGCLRLWNMKNINSPETALFLQGHTQSIKGVTVSPTGGLAATADERGEVLLWDTEKGRVLLRIQTLEPSDNLNPRLALVFSSNELSLATLSDSSMQIWSCNSGKLETSHSFPNEILTSAAHCNVEGWRVSCIQKSCVEVRSLLNNQSQRLVLRRVAKGLRIATLSFDGMLLAYKCDEGVHVLDVKTGDVILSVESRESNWIDYLQFSSDGHFLIAGACFSVSGWNVWDLAAKQRLNSIVDPRYIWSDTVVSSRNLHRTSIVRLTDGQCLALIPIAAQCVAGDADGRVLALAAGNQLYLFAMERGTT